MIRELMNYPPKNGEKKLDHQPREKMHADIDGSENGGNEGRYIRDDHGAPSS